jgi:(p)ppGpp synthase/HD superfamily hydrolase
MLYSFKIEQAIRAAAVLHRDQERKGSAPYPYITHLISVAFLLADYANDEDTVVAGLLHDTLEDTDYTPEELELDFGLHVKNIVLGVTDSLHHERSNYTWAERQQNYFKALDLAPKESFMVSAADKIHNMRSIIEEYSDTRAGYNAEFGRDPLEVIEKHERLHALLTERVDNPIMKEYDHVHTLFIQFLNSIPHDAKQEI